MPLKLTFEKLKEIFEKNNCIISINNEDEFNQIYKNQHTKLNYTASCGHAHIITYKEFNNNHGIVCRNCALGVISYERMVLEFNEKKCIVITAKDEFNNGHKTKINYRASCGHENIVVFRNFTSLGQGINCPSCVNKNTGQKLKELYSGDNKLGGIMQEFRGIEYFIELVKDNFIVVKAFDGCKSDIIIKPKIVIEDLWLGIQVKTTLKKTELNQYYFRLNNGKYDNLIILCISMEDNKLWIIPYEDVKEQKTIGIAKKSKYNKYEINNENLIEKLNDYYSITNKFTFETLNTPISLRIQQEQKYRNIREEKIDFIEFTNNQMEGLVFDFMIGNIKVQEKVGSITHNNPNSFMFNLDKYWKREDGKGICCCYEKGDNDLYWLNEKDTKQFYLIPENILIEKEYIEREDKTQKHLFISPTNKTTEWVKEYKFDYENIDKEKILKIIGI